MLIGNNLGTFIKQEKVKRRVINNLAFYIVPRPGLEPGCLAALVFETSASTYSAIWAWLPLGDRCKGRKIFLIGKAFHEKSVLFV